MGLVFLGLPISLIYSLLSSALLYFSDGKSEAQLFLAAYNTSFKTPIALALIIGTALFAFRSQDILPNTIEATLSDAQLAPTDYSLYRQRLLSRRRSLALVTEVAATVFVVLVYCQFPLQGLAETLMIVSACVQYALLVYVGRKLFYAGMMLHSLLDVVIDRNLFKEREIDDVKTWINMVSALTIIFICIHFIGYSEGPFLFKSLIGEIMRPFLMVPAFLAAATLALLNFHAKFVLGELYSRSISVGEVRPKAALVDVLGGFPQAQEGNISVASKRFRVAFSFAGEQRSYVAKIAAMLAVRFGEAAILYDKFHEAEFARRDLAFYLPNLYQKESDLVIVVVCPSYRVKEWCGLEWDAIFDLLKNRKDEDVMLCRFGRTLVRGLYSTAGFLELDEMTAAQTAARILERLALNEGKPKGYYLSGASVEYHSPAAARDFKAPSSPAE